MARAFKQSDTKAPRYRKTLRIKKGSKRSNPHREVVIGYLELGQYLSGKSIGLLNAACNHIEVNRCPEVRTRAEILNAIGAFMDEVPAYLDVDPDNRAERFYFWATRDRLNEDERYVRGVYHAVAQEYDPHIEISARVFKKGGAALKRRIDRWIKGSGNSFETTLIEYFDAILPSALEYAPGMLHNPAPLFADYGWSLWVEHVEEEYGGRLGYLQPNAKEETESQREHAWLAEVERERTQALQSGDLDLYDMLGQAVARGRDAAVSALRSVATDRAFA